MAVGRELVPSVRPDRSDRQMDSGRLQRTAALEAERPPKLGWRHKERFDGIGSKSSVSFVEDGKDTYLPLKTVRAVRMTSKIWMSRQRLQPEPAWMQLFI